MAWPENAVITVPQERYPKSVVKVSKASVVTHYPLDGKTRLKACISLLSDTVQSAVTGNKQQLSSNQHSFAVRLAKRWLRPNRFVSDITS